MRFKSFQIGKLKDKLGKDSAETDDALAAKMASLEEQVNDKTRELEEAKQRLNELSSTVQVPEEESAPPHPHGPLGELTVEPEDELGTEEIDAETLFDEAGEEVPVVEVIKATAAPTEAAEEAPATAEAEKEAPAATTEAEKAKADSGGDDSLSNLFNDDEEEENPLASLISSLPDVTTQELLDDIQEIKKIMEEWRH